MGKSLFDGLIMMESYFDIIALLKNALQYYADSDGLAPPSSLPVSDGSAGDNAMSFGWVFSKQDGCTLT
jgi:hypothetical protein